MTIRFQGYISQKPTILLTPLNSWAVLIRCKAVRVRPRDTEAPLRAVADAFLRPVDIARQMSVNVNKATNYLEAAREAFKGAKKILGRTQRSEDPELIQLRKMVSVSLGYIKSYSNSFSEGESLTLKTLTNELVANATKLAEKDGRLRHAQMEHWNSNYGGSSASIVDDGKGMYD